MKKLGEEVFGKEMMLGYNYETRILGFSFCLLLNGPFIFFTVAHIREHVLAQCNFVVASVELNLRIPMYYLKSTYEFMITVSCYLSIYPLDTI